MIGILKKNLMKLTQCYQYTTLHRFYNESIESHETNLNKFMENSHINM